MKWRHRKWSLVWLVVGILTPVGAGSLQGDIQKLLRTEASVEYGIHVMDADTGAVAYAHRSDLPMKPASNMKIVASAVALQYLGPDYAFVTRVGLDDDKLVIVGSGDPLLGDEATDQWREKPRGWILDDIAGQLERMGIQKIKDIVVDSTVFDDQRVHPSWSPNDLNKWFAAEICGLNYNGNCVSMAVTNVNGGINVSVEPDTRYLTLTNKIQAVSSGKEAFGAWRQVGQPNHLILKGKVKKKQGPSDVAIEKPATFFGFLLAEHLAQRGIRTEGVLLETTYVPQATFRFVADYRTPLKQCLRRCNKDSFNLAAESLLKAVAAQAMPNGRGGSWVVGQRIVATYLASVGINSAEYVIDDASGLSHKNRLSARALATTLRSMYQSEHWEHYKETFAVGGVDGTIGKYFKEAPYQSHILGKTGYISGVKSFSGVCFTEKKTFIFSILTNRAKGSTRAAINRIAQAIIDNGS